MSEPSPHRGPASAFSGPVAGILWMAGASAFYSLVYIAVRSMTDSLGVAQVVLFRAVLGSVFMLPWLARAGFGGLRTNRIKLYLTRVGFAYLGTVAWMYGIAYMPLADSNALMFTLPLFTVVIAVLLLKEKVGIHRWAATIVGFGGALIIIRPGMIELSLPALATLSAAGLFSFALIATKALVETENPNAVVFYLYTLMIPFAVIPAALEWHPVGWNHVPWLILLGIATVGAQQCSTRAFKVAPANVVIPIHYLQLPLIAALAYLVFDQSVDDWTWVGAAVICAATYYITMRERKARMKNTARA